MTEAEVIINSIVHKYSESWMRNDSAHQQSHFDDVYNHAILIKERLGLDYPDKWIIAAAYFHDLFTYERETHHLAARDFILETDCNVITDLLGIKGSVDRKIVADACAEHRASFKGVYSHAFSDFFASADRGPVKTVVQHIPNVLKRAFKFAQANNPEADKTELCQITLDHVHDKFGTKGYMRLPETYMRMYGKQLGEIRQTFDSLTLPAVLYILL